MSRKAVGYVSTIFMGVISIFCLFPFYMMIIMGTYESNDLYKGLAVFPSNYLLKNIQTVFNSKFLLYYWNSFYISILSTVISVLFSALAGYALAKFEFKLRKSMYNFLLLTMMVPGQVGMVAYIMEMRFLGLNNSHFPLIALWAGNSFGVFLMKQFITEAVPVEVLESARIDGCSEPGIFFKHVLAFIKPAIATLGMFIFLWSWNNYLLPMVILNKIELFTIPLGIRTLETMYYADTAAKVVGLALGTVPILVIFILGSKTFVRGIAAGAVKG